MVLVIDTMVRVACWHMMVLDDCGRLLLVLKLVLHNEVDIGLLLIVTCGCRGCIFVVILVVMLW